MKRLNILSIFILSLFAFIACTDENEHIKLGDKSSFVKPVLTQEVLQNFVVEEDTNLTDSIGYWQWTDANFYMQSPTLYVIQVDTLPTFQTPLNITSTTDTHMKITYNTLNNAALRFVSTAQEITLYFRISASLGNVQAEPVLYSGTEEVTFTCRPSIKSVLYIVGNGLVGWNMDSGKDAIGKDLQLFFADGSSDADLKYTYTGIFQTGGLKFPTQAGVWGSAYAYSGGKLSPNNVGGDFPTTAGLYTLSVDLKTLGITYVEYTGQAPTYTNIEAIGDAVGGWGETNGIVLDNVAEHVWVKYPISLKTGGLKFREGKTWDVSWGASTENDQEYPFGRTGDKNFMIEKAGDYFVALNSLTGHYIIIPVEDLK